MIPTRLQLAHAWRDWWTFSLAPRGNAWLQWAFTAAFCLCIAALITLTQRLANDPRPWLWLFSKNAPVSLTIGLLIQLLYALLVPLIGEPRLTALKGRVVWFHAALGIIGVLAGWPLGLLLAGVDPVEFARHHPGAFRLSLTLGVALTIGISFFFVGLSRAADAERRATQAQLKLLQAQIEPHFLFNTLANVVSLIDYDAPKAKRMLEHFVDYLRSSLGTLRVENSTLGAELTMAEAYLQVLQVRMDDRLRYRIDADASARAAAMPPLLLQPLVENAIQHGLEPKVEGGTVAIHARIDGARLVVSVTDDGLGADAKPRAGGPAGNGVALANIRARLQSLHGDAATLQLLPQAPGMRAVLTLPAAGATR